jgi:hypothetical protein
LRVDYHCMGFLCDRLDHPFSDTILMVSIWRTWFVCYAAQCQHQSECLVVVCGAKTVVFRMFGVCAAKVIAFVCM